MERCRMPVFRRKANALKNFQHYQYRKKSWMSWYGKAFWQTTFIFFIVILVFKNCYNFYQVDCILEPWYQLWIAQLAVWPNLFEKNVINLKKLWLGIAYCPYNRYHYLIPLLICLAFYFLVIPFIIYFSIAAMLAKSMGI